MKSGVTVYDYFADEDDNEPTPIHIVLTADQEPSDMATVLIEELGADDAALVAAAILQQVQGKRVRGER